MIDAKKKVSGSEELLNLSLFPPLNPPQPLTNLFDHSLETRNIINLQLQVINKLSSTNI